MKKAQPLITFVCFILISHLSLFAQQGGVASGGDATGAGGSASYSIGQVDYMAPVGSNGSVHEGLQQPYEFFTVGMEENLDISLELSVYPNPSTTHLLLKIEHEDFLGFSYRLFDMNGKQLLNQQISNSLTEISMESVAAGSYLLMVHDPIQQVKTFKIIKK